MPFEDDTLSLDAAPQSVDYETLQDEIRQKTNRGLYLDAYELAKSRLGQQILQWPDRKGRIIGSRMADCLGGDQLANALTFRLGRDFPDDPEVMYMTTLQKLARRPLARMWVTMRDQELPTDDHELQAMWVILKGIILAGMRDFDRGFELLQRGRELLPDDPRPLLRLASAYANSDSIDLAIQSCRDALQVMPHYTAGVQTLAHFLSQDNQVEESFELLEEAVRTTQSGGCRLQLARMMIHRKDYDQAAALVDGIEDWFPLADPLRKGRAKRDSVWSTIANVRSELAQFAGDHQQAIHWAEIANTKFHDTLAENIAAKKDTGRRVELKVPFVLQKHVTCAPATLTMLSAFWGIEVDHDNVVDEICYDGTAPVKQRAWAEANGMVAREFRVTESSAQALIDAGIPFGLSSIDPGGGHINVVYGYDSRRGVFLIQDPGYWYGIESLVAEFIERYEAFGPRGFLLVPADKQSLLDQIELPDADAFDQQYAIAVALLKHDREAATKILESMESQAPDHWLTLWSQVEVARYDVNAPVRLKAIEKLRELFPGNEILTLAACDLLSLLDRQDLVIKRLRECVGGELPSTESRLRLIELLEGQSDAQERAQQLRLVLRYSPMNPEGLFQESVRLWELRQRDQALELLRLAAMSGERDENHARRYLSAAAQMDRQQEAIGVLKERFERHGNASGQPGMTYAYALEFTTHADHAIQAIHETLRRRPDDGDLICEAASALGRLDSPAAGDRLMSDATIPLPEDQVLFAKANLAVSDGRLQDALAALLDVQKIQPLNPDVVQRIAELKHDLGGFDQSLDYLKSLVEQFPHCRSLLSITAEYLHRAARYDEAIEYLDRILSTCDYDAWAWRERSLVCTAAGRYDEAHQDAARALDCERSAMSYSILADALVGKGQIAEAEENYRAAVLKDCDHVPAILSWSKICENESESRRVMEEVYEQLVDQQSSGAGLYAYHRLVSGLLGQDELAENLQRMRRVRPDVFMTHKLLAAHFIEFRRFDEAEQVLQEVKNRFSHQSGYWRELGEVYLANDRLDTPAESMEQAIEISPFDSELSARLAAVYSALERNSEAETTLRRALRGAPADTALVVALAKTIDDDKERAQLVLKAAMLAPRSDDNWGLLLSLCQFENRDSDAVDAARDLVRQRPHDGYARLRLAETLHREDQWEESVAVIREAIERDPRNADLYGLLAQRYFERDMLDEAIEACSPSDVDPFDLSQLNLYAARLLQQSGKTEDACGRIKEALRRDPTNLEAWSQLAEWSESIEKFEWYDEAAQALLDRAPHLAASHGYFAATLSRNGERAQAKDHLRQAIELDREYVYAVQELLKLFAADGETDLAEAFVKEIDGSVSPEYVAMGKTYVAAANRRYTDVLSILQSVPEDQNPAIVAAGVRIAYQSNPDRQLSGALTSALKRKGAAYAVGIAWGQIHAAADPPPGSAGLPDSVAGLLRFRPGEGRDAAAVAVLDVFRGLIEDADDPTKAFITKSTKRMIRKFGKHIYGSAHLWSAILWTTVSTELYRKGRAIAAKFALVEHRDADLIVPAALAALFQRDDSLAEKIVYDAYQLDPDSLPVEMQLCGTILAIHSRPNEDIEAMIGAIDKNRLFGQFLLIARFISIGMQCIRDRDETAMIQDWKKSFVDADKDDASVDHRVYAELRARVAEARGDFRLAKRLRKSKYVRPS